MKLPEHLNFPSQFIRIIQSCLSQEIQGWGQILSYESIRNEYILDAE